MIARHYAGETNQTTGCGMDLEGRWLVKRAMRTGAELIRHSVQPVTDAFIATRLAGCDGATAMFGALDAPVSKRDADRIVERAHVVR